MQQDQSRLARLILTIDTVLKQAIETEDYHLAATLAEAKQLVEQERLNDTTAEKMASTPRS